MPKYILLKTLNSKNEPHYHVVRDRGNVVMSGPVEVVATLTVGCKTEAKKQFTELVNILLKKENAKSDKK